MKQLLNIIILCLCTIVLYAQNREAYTIQGIVTDDNKEPAIGATVYIKDKSYIGTTTNLDGKFSLKVEHGDRLVVSYVGFETFELLVLKEEQNLRVELQPVTTAIEQVVVTGMGASQRRISISGAVTSVDVAQLQTPATSLTNMLGGVAPGIITLQTSGEPGENISEFWIRGIGTFGASNSAYVLIDGIEGDLNTIDPADVESFTILKDASATAIYGIRGANGVVLVTTKKGVAGKLKIDARVNVKLSQLTRLPDYLRAYDYATLANEANMVRGKSPVFNNEELLIIEHGLDPDLYPDVDWQKEMLKKVSWKESAYLSGQGGGDMARYFVSLGYSSESSAYNKAPDSKYGSSVGFTQFTFRTNVDINLTPTTELAFGADGTLTNKKEPGGSTATTNYTQQLWAAQANITPVLLPTMYSNGMAPAAGSGADVISPYVVLNYTGMAQKEDFNSSYRLELKQDFGFLLEGLKFRMMGSFNKKTFFFERRFLWPALYQAERRDMNGELIMVEKVKEQEVLYGRSEDQERKYHLDMALTYDKVFHEQHRVGGLIYYEMEDYKKVSEASSSMYAIPKRNQMISARLSYSFRDTYFIDGNFAYAGSENFKPGEQWGLFPSVAGSWVPTSYESMMEKAPWLDFLKIRGSYGITGSDKISQRRFPYLTIMRYGSANFWGFNGNTVVEDYIGADNLRWERAKKLDIGVEGQLLDNKVSFVVDYFLDRRDGIFQQRAQIPEYVGLISMPYGNVGRSRSYGSDGNVEFYHNMNDKMGFTIRANYTVTKSKILNWEETEPKYPYQTQVGNPIGHQRGLVAVGLFKDQTDIDNSPKQSFGTYEPGDIKYKDINGDGVIDSEDKVPLAFSKTPRIMYGFGGEFRYKNLTVSALFRGTGNSTFYHIGANYDNTNWDNGYMPFNRRNLGNVLKIVADPSNRWTPASYSNDPATENPNARFPRLSYGKNENNAQLSSFWAGNQRYLRLQEVNINYRIQAGHLLRVLGVSSIDLSLVGNNLAVWDTVKIFDPEQAYKNGQAYPIPRTFTLQAYIHF